MEAAAFSQFCHQTYANRGANPEWLVIRGISDLADSDMTDDNRYSAATNAAHTLRQIIPYLPYRQPM